MSSYSNQESSDGDDNNILNSTFPFFDAFKIEGSIGIFPWLILSAVLFLCFRLLLRSMINLCITNRGIHYMPQECAVEMVPYFNPFTFKLHQTDASYAGIECTLNSTEDCYIIPLWGVPIYGLFELLHENNWNHLKQSICDGTFQSKCLSSNDHFLLHAGKELRTKFRAHDFDSNRIESQPSPRLCYPFVLMMMSKQLPTNSNSQLVLLVNVVHIPDQVIKLPAQLLQQFARSADGTVAAVKNIYPESFEASHIENETVELCLVCMHREISVVIIPCGHACVCRACFELCENCPICRGPKHFYFVSCVVSQH